MTKPMTKPMSCTGCGEPFNSLRKPRAHIGGMFMADDGGQGAPEAPAVLCGVCRDKLRVWGVDALPGLVAHFERIEATYYAKAEGGQQ